MANNYTLFSVAIENVTPAEIEWLMRAYGKLQGESYAADEDIGFELAFLAPTTAVVFAEESGDPDSAVKFIQRFMRAHRPQAFMSLEWAETCSKPRPGEFGGGACVFSASEHWYMSTRTWCQDKLRELNQAHPVAPSEGKED
jgi:hypothetical protein